MGVDSFRSSDTGPFLTLARSEGWVCDQWELDFLLGSFSQGCFVWRDHGEPVAFITAANYGESGWIGNLIVTPQLRGNGVGTTLMHWSLAALEKAGVRTVWLTASSDGEPLYTKLGFSSVDTVCRWRGESSVPLAPAGSADLAIVRSMDRSGWGDSREAALAMLAARGALFTEENGFIICHPSADGVQLGPWGSSSAATAKRLLERVLQFTGKRVPLFLDVPQQNRAAETLLRAHGFVSCGSTRLMYRGLKPAYNPARVYSLASMGSFG